MKNNYEWQYGESEYQRFFECNLGENKLLIFANKYKESNPNLFIGTYTRDNKTITIEDKIYNDRQKKKAEKNNVQISSFRFLGSEDIEKMKQKVIYCYEHNLKEISA